MSWLTGGKKVGTISGGGSGGGGGGSAPADWATATTISESMDSAAHQQRMAEIHRRIAESQVALTNATYNPLRDAHTVAAKYVTPRAKIAMRLDVPEGSSLGFQHIDALGLNDEKMVVFLIVDGKPMYIEDDRALFPSDTLITQLRILRR